MPDMSSHPRDSAAERPRPSSGRRGRRRGVAVRPEAIKQARLEAGLSLGQVARGDISRTAIYFVETGKAKPSMETLRLIADRTGRPVDFFLAEPATAPLPAGDIADLERLLATGDNVGVAARSEHLLGQRLDEESVARVKLIAALAYLRMAQPVPGRRYAAAARAFFESSGDRLRTAEALGTEAQAAYLVGDPSALGMAETALETLRSLKSFPQSTESRLLTILASVYLMNGRWQEAIETYEQAIAAGAVVQDLQRLSLMYSGLSIAYKESGQINDAARYAQKALTIHETLHDRLSLARSLNNLGYMLIGLKEYASARRHIQRAIQIFEEEGVEVGRGNHILSMCELELEEGNLEQAYSLATEAATLAGRLGEAGIEAEAHTWLGRIAAERGDDRTADTEFAAALSAAESAGSYRAAQVHEAYADVLEARGDLAEANRHLKRALAVSERSDRRTAETRIAIA